MGDFKYHMAEFKRLKAVFIFNFLEVNYGGMYS